MIHADSDQVNHKDHKNQRSILINQIVPEVNVNIEWPDKQRDSIYSPSTVLLQYIKSGDSLSVQDFDERISKALQAASQRVYERYGFECTSAMGELARLKARIGSIDDKNQLIKVL